MSARLGNITFDCVDALVLGTFWSRVLGRSLDQGGSTGYCSIGRGDANRSEPAWFFEKVPESKTSKNRVHLDLVVSEPDAVQRLVMLGASIVAEHAVESGDQHWTVMQDPEGNEFCVSSTSYVG
ncbi:MAG TPA: VOC family protein [Acidimicrobiales bacterium]|nr:VOC family protein [Acidimicrobiales bacterium]